MPTIFIDNKAYEIKEGLNVLHAAVSEGLNLPYFCWHPALGSAGACRQCAVQHFKDEQDTQGRMVMACMTAATEGARFSIEHPQAKSFRADIIEWMMTNHPHDCPVCDEGGECHLQDMTVMSGHNKRRYRFKKRTFKNQDLGPYINHEMNRCITCYRCVRYYQDVAGGTDLHSFASSNRVYFGRFEDGQLENEFSGNLVEVCPTGVFTDKTFKALYSRKWDLQTAPSVCQICSLGCNITPGERLGNLRRVQNRFHPEINGYFLCDKGRFGHRFVNEKSVIPAAKEIAPLDKKQKLIGISSPRASIEANYALFKLVGKDNFYDGHSLDEHNLLQKIMQVLSQYPETASMQDIREADRVFVLGEDLTQTAPMLALSIRQNLYKKAQAQAAQKQIPDWNDIAIRNAEPNLPDCLYLALDSVSKLDSVATQKRGTEEQELNAWMSILEKAKNPVIIAGTSLGGSDSKRLIELSLHMRQKNPNAKLCYVLPAANSFGLALLNPQSPSQLTSLSQETVVILENNSDFNFEHSIVIDFLETKTSQKSNQALGCASFAETTGSMVNNEGRAQRYYSVFQRRVEPRPESWRIVKDLGDFGWETLDDLSRELAQEFPVFEAFFQQVHRADFRIHGQKIARQSQEYSGRTALYTQLSMHEARPKPDPDSPLAYSMEGYHGDMPPDLASAYWRPGWDSSQGAFNALSHATSGVKLKPIC